MIIPNRRQMSFGMLFKHFKQPGLVLSQKSKFKEAVPTGLNT